MNPAAKLKVDALAATSCSVVITDATSRDNPIIYANAAFSALSGYALPEIFGRNCRFLQGAETDRQALDDIGAAIAAGIGIRREILNYRKDGTPFWNALALDPIRDAAGRVISFIGIQSLADVVHTAVEAKVAAESRLASIADNIPGYIYRIVMTADGTANIVYASPSIRKFLGTDEHEHLRTFDDHVHPDDYDELMTAIRNSAANMSIFREEFRLISQDGTTHWLRTDAPPRRMGNGEIVWDGVAVEISAEKRWESEIASLALRDPLTGLLTRAAWHQALAVQLSVGRSQAGRCAVLCFDIAGFGVLNDRLGQSAGEEVLRETARRLSKIAASVAGTAARLGGDGFAILIPACREEDALSALAKRANEAVGLPIQIDGQPVTIKTHIGATVRANLDFATHCHSDPAGELTRQAEVALRASKRQGQSGYVLFSPELDDGLKKQLVLERSLETAIANGQLSLLYQPLVDLASGRVVSAEALVRWNHPTLGMQGPDDFVPLAEKLGLIVQLGRWVFDHALRQRTQWQEAGLRPPAMAINVSGDQLLDPEFIDFVVATLRTTGASAEDFEIELTEGLLIEPSPRVMASLHALRTMGFTVSIDDFGSGHASFRYLRDFPVDKLKIDQIFVRKLVLESTDAMIIQAVISLARAMGVGLVAEGIETEMQRDFLLREGCTIGQGYLFSMPLVAEDFACLLANNEAEKSHG